MTINPTEIGYVFDYIHELCGIALDESKAYLIDARLGKLVKQYSAASPVDLITRAKAPAGDPIRRSLVEAMTTRETFFFRDNSPFEALQFKALPELLDVKIKERSNKLRIWSAAASSGQEACSIGIILHEMIPDLHNWDIQILATDISEDALEKGRSGVYTALEVERGLPPNFAAKYFCKWNGDYKVMDSVHRMIRFQQLNLLAPFNFPYQFDIIFCRNVAIYFEKSDKIDLFRRMLKILTKHGLLFVGVSESLFDCGPEFKPLHHCKGTFYQPNLTQITPARSAGLPATAAASAAIAPTTLPRPTTSPIAAKPISPATGTNAAAGTRPTVSPTTRTAVTPAAAPKPIVPGLRK